MTGLESRVVRQCLTVLMCFVVGVFALGAQRQTDSDEARVTTQQRLESELWWPTMSTSPLESYVGTTRCVGCHTDVGDGLSGTSVTAMAGAASRFGGADFVRTTSGGSFESGDFKYFLHAGPEGLEYSVSRENETALQRLDWVMGSGELGRTFVYQRDRRWFQSRLSEYRVAPKVDVTTGLTVPAHMEAGYDLSAALGKVLTTEEIRHCFSCHTVHATSSKGFNPEHAEAGLGCEACHGPGAAHLKATDSRTTARDEMAIFNPAKLSPTASIDFCGACHRTFGDVTQAANPANDSSVVRFQPYRLEKSRCWRETEDERLTCVACHDPHLPLVRDDASYDNRCLDCHRSGLTADHAGKVCPTGAKAQCVSCHMQSVKVASMHGEFTDHFIRVVRPGEGFQK
jgi:hypothetical protein